MLLKLKGFPIAKAQEHLKRVQNMTEEEFISDVDSRKWNIFNYHVETNSNYQKFLQNTKITNWEDIPILAKKDLQVPLSEKISNNFNQNNVYKGKTSGSSGNPLVYAKDKFCHALTWAVILDRYERHGINLNKSKQARFYGMPIEFPYYQKEKFKDFLMNRVRFSVLQLSDPIFNGFIKRLLNNQFDYLYGYSSSLVLFAKYLIEQKIKFHELSPSVKVCIVTSEMCTMEDRKLLKIAFGVPIINEYGVSELDLVAFEDQNLDWIMTNENLYFEVIDEYGQVLPAGNSGRLIVTSLYNKAMPFIRYELGDIVSIKKEKIGLHNILKSLDGRNNDFVKLPSGKVAPGLTFYYITKAVMDDKSDIKEFIIIQEALDTFKFEYVSNKPLTESEKNKVKLMMEEYLESGLKAHFEQKRNLNRSGSGKLKQFTTLV